MTDKPRNPKMEGSACIDCRPQTGECPNNCSQCFYNRPGAFYCNIDEPQIPTMVEVGDKIVRMNSGHDSNLDKELVLAVAGHYPRVFFNTSMPDFDFPGPVVFTANAKEEEPAWCPIVNRGGKTRQLSPKKEAFCDRLMFVRLRVSPTNLGLIEHAVAAWTAKNVPVVLTFMAYYNQHPPGTEKSETDIRSSDCYWAPPYDLRMVAYTWRKRIINSYYCATPRFETYVVQRMQKFGRTLVTMCGTLDGGKCRDCRNCETHFIQRAKYLSEKYNRVD